VETENRSSGTLNPGWLDATRPHTLDPDFRRWVWVSKLLALGRSLALSWVLARWLFEIEWRPAPGLLATGVVVATVLVGLVGLAASADVLIRKPLATLRNE